jgi:hypothetical protein
LLFVPGPQALSAAHEDPESKRAGRQLLAVEIFTMNLSHIRLMTVNWKATESMFDHFKRTLRTKLEEKGLPLHEAYVKEKRGETIGVIASTPLHPLMQASNDAGQKQLRLDIPGVVPLPPWNFSGHKDRSASERSYMHMVKMISIAVNVKFHERSRVALAPHAIPGLGVMKLAKNGKDDFALSPEKGFARMNSKRTTDHRSSSGCRPALNIDCCRLIVVVQTPEDLVAAVNAVAIEYGGVGRVKDGFAAADASEFFNLRTVLCNSIVDFGLNFGDLAKQAAPAWEAYVASRPEGGEPRGRWASEARRAFDWLVGESMDKEPVRFICEVGRIPWEWG